MVESVVRKCAICDTVLSNGDEHKCNPPEDTPKIATAAGEPLTKYRVKSSTLQSSQEEDEDSHK